MLAPGMIALLATASCLPQVRGLAGTRSAHVHTVSLSKQYVPVHRGDRVVAYKTAYFGSVFVGLPKPQRFSVLFDTGSGHFVLPSSACADPACTGHRRYDRALSTSAVGIDYDGTRVHPNASDFDKVDILFGTGKVSGPFVEEVVCFGGDKGAAVEEPTPTAATGLPLREGCVQLRVVAASNMTRDPFQHFAFDGVVGLGLEALALHRDFSFVGQLNRLGHHGGQPYFGVYLARSDLYSSEISFGGHNEERILSPLAWAPVASPDMGYWQIQLRSVRIGNETVSMCADGSCRAVLDTGTSLLGVPREVAASFHLALARPVLDGASKCRHPEGPALIFDLGALSLRLDPEDYWVPSPVLAQSKSDSKARRFCRPSLLPVDMGSPLGPKTFIFGEPILRRYYTAYDWQRYQIGFARARQASDGSNQAQQEALPLAQLL
mmetsp:Transcript_35210/g.75016  ORF Transcript_35210/g.75016 Transcript_35210/m.75016 type:complete len:436 (+) Transcript_35210:144-1451(+)